jgi:hypothetical protein
VTAAVLGALLLEAVPLVVRLVFRLRQECRRNATMTAITTQRGAGPRSRAPGLVCTALIFPHHTKRREPDTLTGPLASARVRE